MALLPLLCALVLAGALGAGAAAVRRAPVSAESTVAAARRHARLTATAAVVLGAAAAVGTAGTEAFRGGRAGGLGVTVLLVPVVYGIVHTVVLGIGELTWPRPTGEVRRARLVHRGPLDAAPAALVRLAAGAGAIAVLVIAGGALLAGPDGRSFTSTRGSGVSATSSTASPFPGWFYGRPALVGLLVLAVLVAAALWLVAERPAVVTRDERVEEALRRASAHRVLRVAVAALLVDTGGLLHIAGTAMPDDGPLRYLGVALGVLGAVVVLTGVVVGCLRTPDVPSAAPAVPVP